MMKIDNDYADLLNCVQRHTKYSSAYCLRKKNSDKEQYCRFNFPFENCDTTHIDFEEIKTKKNGVQFRPKIVSIVDNLKGFKRIRTNKVNYSEANDKSS
jgi:hypothetical protein